MDAILVVAPHPDDESIGCGGSIALDSRAGSRVSVLFLSSGELGIRDVEPEVARVTREREAEAAGAVLGLARLTFARLPDYGLEANLAAASDAIARIIREEEPGTIFVPHAEDAHPDHAAAAKALRLATHDGEGRIALGYEVWTPIRDVYTARDVSDTMRTKLEAIRCHRSQLTLYPYDRAIWGLNRYRGVTVTRRPYAEAFAAVPLGEAIDANSVGLASRYV